MTESAAAKVPSRSKFRRVASFALPALPGVLATFIALLIAAEIRRDKDELLALRDESRTTSDQLASARADLASTAKKREDLARQVDELNGNIATLTDRERKLREAVEAKDPTVAIAKVRATLGGRTPGERADSLWRRGDDAFRAKQLDLAEALFEEAHREDPSFAPALNGLGRIAADRGNRTTAEKYYRLAVQADPKYKFGYLNLAYLYFFQKKYDKAEENALKALEVDPEYQEAREFLGTIRKNRGGR